MHTLPGKELAAIHSLKSLFDGASQITVTDAVEAFLHTDMAGKSANTVCWYRRKLGALIDFLGDQKLLSDTMEYDLMDWYSYLDQRRQLYGVNLSSTRPSVDTRLSTYTKHGHVRAVKRFFRWLYQKKLLAVDLGQAIRYPFSPMSRKFG